MTALRSAPPTQTKLSRAKQRRRDLFSILGWPTAFVVSIVAIWEGVSRGGLVDPIIMPPPSEVASAFYEISRTEYFWSGTWATVQETIFGFLLGCGLAWGLGMAIGLSKIFRRAVYPLVVGFQNMPRVALAPLFLTWFGFGMTSKVVMAATICFFPLLISIVVGLETVDRDARTLMRSLGASRWETYRRLELPSSLPFFFAGLKTAMTLALIGAIVAEFVGANEGMGVMIKTYNFQLNVAEGFATIFTLMFIGLILFGLMEWLDRKIVFWRAGVQ
jgi:NitT/TauT family transport system permease protein